MRCPFCSNDDTQVKDSRPTGDNSAIRRRRACTECGARFTTFERIQLREMIVLKTGDQKRKQSFDRDKLVRSMELALRKRPIDTEQIEKAANSIVRQLETAGEPEIASARIGELVMNALARMDMVAYIRYASVYKDFCRPEDFNEFLDDLKAIQNKDQLAAE